MPSYSFFPLLVLLLSSPLLLLFLPSSFAAAPLELKVQIVGWRQLPFYDRWLESSEPGKRFLVTLSKKGCQTTGISRTEAAGHYEIATFQLPEEWEREMMTNPPAAVNPPTSEFVRNNDFQLEIALSPDVEYRNSDRRLFNIDFQLTSRQRNFVRIALRTRGPMAIAVLSASELDLPVRHLLFKIQDNDTDKTHGQESTSSTTAKAAAEAPPPFMLTRIECPTGGWSVGDNNSWENHVLLAKRQRVCEDDHYLMHYEPVDGDLLGNLLWWPGQPRDLICPEAMFDELDRINGYTIGMKKDGQLTCQLDTPPLARQIVQYILLSQPHNIAAIWPHIVKMHLEKDYKRFEKLLETPNPLAAGPVQRKRAQQVDIDEGQSSGSEQERQQLNPNKRQKNIHNPPLGQQQHPFVASATANSQQTQEQMQLELQPQLQQRQQVQHIQQQRVQQQHEMQQQPEVENQLQQQVRHAQQQMQLELQQQAQLRQQVQHIQQQRVQQQHEMQQQPEVENQLQQQVRHAQQQQQRVERQPAFRQRHHHQPSHYLMPQSKVGNTIWRAATSVNQNQQAQQHSLDGEAASSAQQVAEQQPQQHQQQHTHQYQEEAQQLQQPANAGNEWSPSNLAELDELLFD